MKREYQSKLLHETFTRVQHSSGLTIYMYPSTEATHSNAHLAVNYGSIDVHILENGKITTLPEGTSHFLEHILFENSNRSTSLFASTGATANAFCTYDRTVYYFSCVDRFKESLQILINAILTPIFNSSLVDTVRNVINQEIKLYQNNPIEIANRNLLNNLYHSHALKTDIAGTEQSIKDIESNLLLKAYVTAYNPSNMTLLVTGRFDETEVINIVDSTFTTTSSRPTTAFIQTHREPQAINSSLIVHKTNSVYTPLFCIGFKGICAKSPQNLYDSILDELIVELLIGEISPTYQDLYDKGIISTTITHESMCNRDYAVNKLSGEADNPYIVLDALKKAIAVTTRNGFNPVFFECCKKAMIGRFIYYYDDLSILANYIIVSHFSGTDIYSLFDYIRAVKPQQINTRLLSDFNPNKCTISIVEPLN